MQTNKNESRAFLWQKSTSERAYPAESRRIWHSTDGPPDLEDGYFHPLRGKTVGALLGREKFSCPAAHFELLGSLAPTKLPASPRFGVVRSGSRLNEIADLAIKVLEL